jgi:hypothetical protein
MRLAEPTELSSPHQRKVKASFLIDVTIAMNITRTEPMRRFCEPGGNTRFSAPSVLLLGRPAEAFYDSCCLTHMAAELAIAMTKNSMAPSRKLLYEIGFLPAVAAGRANIPATASTRVIKAKTVEMTPIQ